MSQCKRSLAASSLKSEKEKEQTLTLMVCLCEDVQEERHVCTLIKTCFFFSFFGKEKKNMFRIKERSDFEIPIDEQKMLYFVFFYGEILKK